jgi:predicted metal-binding membrane protein
VTAQESRVRPHRIAGWHVGGSHRGFLPAAVLMTAGGAWLVLLLSSHWTATSSPSGHVHGHIAPPAVGTATVAGLTGWSLMVVAMMLPPALPLLRMLQRLVARHRTRRLLVLSGVGSFLAVWFLVGLVLVMGDAVVSVLARDSWRPDPQVVIGGVLLLAGVFQLSPLKSRCLTACRSPRSFAVAYWHGKRRPAIEAAIIGSAYGASCVGCCWALMLVCFTGGSAHLATMVPLAVVMMVERTTPWGIKLVWPIGLAILSSGAMLLAASVY